jgi:hypothetical protein
MVHVMSEVKRYRATIGNGSTSRREWVYLCRDVESSQHEQLFKSVSAQAVDQLSELQQQLDAQRLRADTAEAELARVCGDEWRKDKRKLASAEQRIAELEERYNFLSKVTPHKFKKMQEAASTDGGDVIYFHADRFDAQIAAALSHNPDCCKVSAQDRALLEAGDHTPEELFGVGGKPSCPKCFNPKPEAESHESN